MTGTADTEAEEFQRSTTSRSSSSRPTGRWSARTRRPRLQERGGQVQRGRREIEEMSKAAGRSWSAPSRSRRASSSGSCCNARDQAPGPERQVPRAGGGHRRSGGPPGRGDHRHQHGGPRHRHPPRPWSQGRGRPAHRRHRAARGAADRQSAPRPRRPPGRSRLERFFLSLEDD